MGWRPSVHSVLDGIRSVSRLHRSDFSEQMTMALSLMPPLTMAETIKLICPRCSQVYVAISGEVRYCLCGERLVQKEEPKP
jgi:hypothetical protein